MVRFSVVPPAEPTPGPRGLMIRLLLLSSAKTPPALKFGAPNDSLPVNGDPSLHVALSFATTVPSGAVLGIVGLGGLLVIPRNVPVGTYATSTK
jgi:hypothetical protein